jgi:glycosyltransferase involved in cell wall biosynthesis
MAESSRVHREKRLVKVLRVYHAGRDPGHRRRERALVSAGAEVRLVVPASWGGLGGEESLGEEPFDVVELEVVRNGDVNRHRYRDDREIRAVIGEWEPDVIDIHEEPFSLVSRQWLRAAEGIPTVMYTAQNIDKRFPPPFAQYERNAYREVSGLYPCSRQAASVARGKGYTGPIRVLPLGYDPSDFHAGAQAHRDPRFVLGLVGRLVPEKGVLDAVKAVAELQSIRHCCLRIVGEGPEGRRAESLAAKLGVADWLSIAPWSGVTGTAAAYRGMHVLLVPSRTTSTWVEQFGRVIVEAQASGCVVVAYDSGAIAEVVGNAGLVVEEGDLGALTAAVGRLALEGDLWGSLRQAGLEHAGRRTWEEVAREQLRLYEAAQHGTEPAGGDLGDPRVARLRAHEEFGPSAATGIGLRPAALPLLRSSPGLNQMAGRVIDVVSASLRRAGLAR